MRLIGFMGDRQTEHEIRALADRERSDSNAEDRRVRIARVCALALEGIGPREAARRLGMGKNTATKYRRLAGVELKREGKQLGGGDWSKRRRTRARFD